MTALAEERQLGDEHAVVVAAVRVVAGGAAVDHRRVLPEERAALLGVAARAALVDGRPTRSSLTFTEPCTLWQDEQCILPSRTGMWLKRCCLLVMVWWQRASADLRLGAHQLAAPSAECTLWQSMHLTLRFSCWLPSLRRRL